MSSRAPTWSMRPYYWWFVISLPAVSSLAHTLSPSHVVFRGQGLGVLTGIAGGFLAVILWLGYRPQQSAHRLLKWFVILTAAGWLYAIVRIQLDDSLFNLTVFLVPLVLVLVWLKPPSASDLLVSLQVIAYGLALVSVISLILGATGIGPNGFAVSDASPCRLGPACDVIGLIPGAENAQLGVTRWGGPFGSVNIASPAGGLVLMIGLISRGSHRWILGTVGAAILVLGQARLTLVAVAIAVLVLVALGGPSGYQVATRAWRAYIGAGLLVLIAVVVIVQDPTFSGRVGIWSGYLDVWKQDILFGIGDSGVRDYVLTNPSPYAYDHAHGVLLDAGVRYGLVLALFLAALYVIASIAAVRILRRGWVGPLAVLVFIILAGSAETLYRAEYWTFYLAILITIVAGIPASSTRGLEPQDQGHALRSGH